MEHLFISLYKYLTKHRKIVFLSTIILFLLMGLLSSHIVLKEDISSFLPDKGVDRRLVPIYKQLSMGNEIYVSFSTRQKVDEDERISLLSEAAEHFSATLDSMSGKTLIKQIICQVDASKALDISDFITSNLPYFLKEDDFSRIDSLIKSGNYDKIFDNNRSLLLSPMGLGIDENIMSDPFHFSTPLLKRLQQLKYDNHYSIVDDYIFSNDHQHLIMFVISANNGSETGKNAQLAKNFKETLKLMPDNIRVDYFGAPLIAVSNAKQIKADTMKSLAIASFFILLILLLFFRDFRPLIYVMVSVSFGILFGLSLIYIFNGEVSSIALGAGSVIIGIAINYALHYTIHLQHHPDPDIVLHDIANPMIVGNITTIGAFLSLLLISAQAMRDLGLFAALTLVGTILFVLCILPHWARTGKSTMMHIQLEKYMNASSRNNKWLVIGCVIITIFLSFFCNDVQFETDFNKINYMTSAEKMAFKEMSHNTPLGNKAIYHISQAKDLNSAMKELERQKPVMDELEKEKAISSWIDYTDFVPSDSIQQLRIIRWNKFLKQHKSELIKAVNEYSRKYGFTDDAFSPFINLLNREFKVEPPSYFKILTDNLLKGSIISDNKTTSLVSVIYTEPSKTKYVYDKLNNSSPNSFVFDRQSFTKQLVEILSNDFNLVFYICGFLVFFFLWYSFGRIELSGIAFLPMAISWIWILGIMGLFDIRFNIVNIILSTFIFGLGDDYTIFIVDGLVYEYAYKKKMLSSYKTSVFLSALFMLVGIGSMIIALHPAVRSLAVITIIGMFCVVLIAFIVPQLLFKWIAYHKGKPRLTPITWLNLLLTIYSFIIFLIGSITLTIYGTWLLKILKPTEKNKLKLHKALQSLSKFVVTYIPGVKHEFINYDKHLFDKPAVIVCNHQSHLDLMYLLMMSPKIIVLTNQWAWNFIFYRRILRYVDFYPVINGIEDSITALQEMVNKGYSVAIFPEGTRSEDGKIARFHRGAFYLAEQLKCNILPIVFHGIGHILPKSELLLRNGKVTVKVLPLISPTSNQFGNGYIEHSKSIHKYMIREYEELVQKEETVSYFIKDVKGNYRYKGSEVEKEVRHSLSDKKQLEKLINSLPQNSSVVMYNCGVGCITLLAALARKDIVFEGYDEDENNISLADYCRLKPINLTYHIGNISDIEREGKTVIDLSKYQS